MPPISACFALSQNPSSECNFTAYFWTGHFWWDANYLCQFSFKMSSFQVIQLYTNFCLALQFEAVSKNEICVSEISKILQLGRCTNLAFWVCQNLSLHSRVIRKLHPVKIFLYFKIAIQTRIKVHLDETVPTQDLNRAL